MSSPQPVILISVFRNELHNLDWFLEHYRAMGVTEFHIIDNASTDGTGAALEAAEDVTVHLREGSFGEAYSGRLWMNELRTQYGVGKWCLYVDSDEMLVYPGWPNLSIQRLCERMEKQGARGLVTMMLDMFDATDPLGRIAGPGEHPLEAYPNYAPALQRVLTREVFPFVGFSGGPRSQLFGEALQEIAGKSGVNLRKIPLIFSQTGEEYVSAHSTQMMPLAEFTGVLLHFKINGRFPEQAKIESDRRQHAKGSVEYIAYHQAFETGTATAASLGEVSTWSGPVQLWQEGLMVCPPRMAELLARQKVDDGYQDDKSVTCAGLTLWPSIAYATKDLCRF